jgi:hypothetical protein
MRAELRSRFPGRSRARPGGLSPAPHERLGVIVGFSEEKHSENAEVGMTPLWRGSRISVGGSRRGGLRRLPSRRAADAGGLAEARAQPPDQGARPTGRVTSRGCGARGRAVVSIRWGASERLTFASRDNQHAPRAGLGELGYGSTTAAKEVAPQIVAQSPSDSSEIRIKHAPVSGQS